MAMATKHICVGVTAHVDAGKTTLNEALLYTGGQLRRLGRVDHGDAYLDTDQLERERGITIFSKQALLPLGEDKELVLMDTPGHADFSAEMERTLQVLDCAVLVISGTDGVQGHTRTLWRLLERYHLPVFLFVNKMDLAGADRSAVLKALREGLDSRCTDFTAQRSARDEEIALCDEGALEDFLSGGAVPDEAVARLVAQRKLFPCWFGSALKLEGVEELLSGLERYAPAPDYPKEFAARVFKITRDDQGNRLTWMKITGGSLKAKTPLSGGAGEERWEEKADQLRLYSGAKFRVVDRAEAGCVVADPHAALPKLRQLEEEDPMLRFVWDSRWKQIQVRLMGQVQLEVLKRVIAQRFDLEVDFGPGRVLYRETIADTVEGIGHFEPLRHYAEVHLLLEPGPRGSGVQLATACSTDQLDLNWQRLIFTHLLELDHPGVLTGSPLTDVKITLLAGRAHEKHTEGGDFRQATYRAVRQGLMQAESVLLEPFYDFTLEVPAQCVGRAMTDIQAMGGTVEPPQSREDMTVLTGFAPVAGMRDYWQTVTAYTRGCGQLSCAMRGYEPCHNADEVVGEMGYDPERDEENPAGSVFCPGTKWRPWPMWTAA